MPVSRIFLDWKHPALPQAADYLRSLSASPGEVDLRDVIVVLPTARAGHRLLEILVENASARSLRLIPPEIITLRHLPELLYTPKRPFADPLTQQFAWVEALKSLKGKQRSRLMRRLPDATLLGWLSFASMLSELHRELVANIFSFAHVAKAVAAVGEEHEISRWELLRQVEEAYLRLLDDLGLWDRQTARLVALERQEFVTESRVVLVGTVDLNAAHRAMLEQIADRVTALIVAPKSRADWFDAYGGLVTERWQNAPIEGIFEKTDVVDGPDDQALAVCLALSEWNGRFPAEDITVGVPDSRIAPAVEERLGECGLKVHNALGQPLLHTGPARVLSAVANLLESLWFRDLANLARHPAVESWLEHQGVSPDWLLELDDYSARHFPARLDDPGPNRKSRRWRTSSDRKALAQAIAAIEELLAPLRRRKQPVTDWIAPIRELLLGVFGIRPLDRDHPEDRKTLSVIERIEEALVIIEDLPPSLAPRITGAEAVRLVLRELEVQLVIDPPGENQVALAGWLDLPWDDAPALVVTGMNEGIVPTSQNPDAFLPNSLRRQMNLDDNDRRLARDAYALSVLAASRRELRLILGRRTQENDPLSPSRLLFACEPEEMPARVQRLFSTPKSLRNRVEIADGLSPAGEGVPYSVPRPQPLPEPVTSMRVTEFSAYLECPYRYYLAYRLRLQAPEASAEELPPNAFGDMIHDVLEKFGEEPLINHSTDAERISEFLSDTLSTQTLRKFGRHPLPAVRIQIEQARLRLEGFANWQAKWAGEGWEIRFAEQAVAGEQAPFLVDGEPMYLRGRMDRIDVRERAGGLEVTILDYKTSDTGASPDEKHRDKEGRWTDLQLPLYRHLMKAVEGLPESENIQLGYIILPKRTVDIGFRPAEWTEADLADADQAAADVVRAIRREIFWPPNPNPRYFAEFAAICQDDLFGTAMQEEGEPN